MAGEGERGEAGLLDGDPDFLGELADERRFRPLARLDLAAGKFPQAGERLALRPLRDQDASVDIDQGDGDDEDEAGHNPARAALAPENSRAARALENSRAARALENSRAARALEKPRAARALEKPRAARAPEKPRAARAALTIGNRR